MDTLFWQDLLAARPHEHDAAPPLPHLLQAHEQLTKLVQGEAARGCVLNVYGPSGCGKTTLVKSALRRCGVLFSELHPWDCSKLHTDVASATVAMLHHRRTLTAVLIFMKDMLPLTHDAAVQMIASRTAHTPHLLVLISTRRVLTRRVKRAVTHLAIPAPCARSVQRVWSENGGGEGANFDRGVAERCGHDLSLVARSARTGFLCTKEEGQRDLRERLRRLWERRCWSDDLRVAHVVATVYPKQTDYPATSATAAVDAAAEIAEAVRACDLIVDSTFDAALESYYGMVTWACVMSANVRVTNVAESSNHGSRRSHNLKALSKARALNPTLWNHGRDPSLCCVWYRLLLAPEPADEAYARPGWVSAYRTGSNFSPAAPALNASKRRRLEKICQRYASSEQF